VLKKDLREQEREEGNVHSDSEGDALELT